MTITAATLTSDPPLLIRTDFTNDALCAEIRDTAMAERSVINAEDRVTAQAQIIPRDDPQFDGYEAEEIASCRGLTAGTASFSTRRPSLTRSIPSLP